MALAGPAGAPLTARGLEVLPDDGRRYELIDGTLIVTPAPGVPHQIVAGAVYRLLWAARPEGMSVVMSPVDFVPNPATSLQPDVAVIDISEASQPRLTLVPHLVVEVMSPSSRTQDLGAKRLAYAQAGVPNYWVVDPVPPAGLLVLRL